MRAIRCALILTCVLLGVRDLTPVAHAQKMTYGVKVMVAKAADLAKAKTYTWTVSQPSPDKTVDAQIVAAVDRQLSALGFTKVASGTSDLLATRLNQANRRESEGEGQRERGPAGALRSGPSSWTCATPRPGSRCSGSDRHPDRPPSPTRPKWRSTRR